MEKIILIFTCFCLGLISLKLWYGNFSKSKRQRKRFRRGVKLEQKAAKFLVSKGFKVVGEQLPFDHTYWVDGEEQISTVNVDYLVEKEGEVFVVEVKSGKSAISIKNRSTRRQLLEYATAIDCDGVYLLDMENKNLQLIEFQFPNRAAIKKSNVNLILFGIIVLLLCYIYYFKCD